MSRKTHRAGAFAAIAMLVTSFFGAASSGAFAEDPVSLQPAVITAQSEVQSETEITPGPRFVAQEVVQPLPATPLPDSAELPAEEAEKVDAPTASLVELVAEIPADDALSRDMTCLAEAVYFEARGEPLDGQIAVAEVIVNRAQSPLFPDDYCAVVTQRSQFSFVRNGQIPEPKLGSPEWRKAKAVARIAHEELWDSPASDALFFHATYVKPKWARTKLAAATIQRHVFYK